MHVVVPPAKIIPEVFLQLDLEREISSLQCIFTLGRPLVDEAADVRRGPDYYVFPDRGRPPRPDFLLRRSPGSPRDPSRV